MKLVFEHGPVLFRELQPGQWLMYEGALYVKLAPGGHSALDGLPSDFVAGAVVRITDSSYGPPGSITTFSSVAQVLPMPTPKFVKE